MHNLPLSLDLSDFDWKAGRIVKQFMRINVLDSSDTLRTLACGMVEVSACLDNGNQLSVVAPLLVQGEGFCYEYAWDGNISIDDRQHTHIVLYGSDGSVIESRQVYEDIEDVGQIYIDTFEIQENKEHLYSCLGYEKDESFVDVDGDVGELIKLPVRFFPTVTTKAKMIHVLVKKTEHLIHNGANFSCRGEYTQYLLLLTSNKRWMLCVRTSDSTDLLPVEDIINETVRTFDYDQEDDVITYLLESGFDPLDPALDEMNEAIAHEILMNT